MASHYDESSAFSNDEDGAVSINDHPAVLLPDASFLLLGTFEKSGFDLIITNPAGETHIVYDYFAFDPPPNLMLAGGAGFSPEMVMHKLHLPFGEDVMFAGPATSATNQIEVGKVTLLLGTVTAKRVDANGEVIEVRLSRGDTLYKGDEITTGGRAFIKAKMLDGTKFHLGKNANAVLTEFVFNEEARVGNFEAFVTRGGFHYKSGKIGKMLAGGSKDHSTISTPTAIIGIRGSELDGNVDPVTGDTVVVQRSGFLTISDINGQNEVVLDTTGNTSQIVLNGQPTKTDFPSPQALESLAQNLPPPDTAEELLEDEIGEQEPTADERPDQGERPSEGEGEPSTVPEEEPSAVLEEEGSAEGEEETSDEENDEGSDEGDEDLSAEGEEDSSAEGEQKAPANAGGKSGTGTGNKAKAAGESDNNANAQRRTSAANEEDAVNPDGEEGEPTNTGTGSTQPAGDGDSGSTPIQQTGQTGETPDGLTIRENEFQNSAPDIVGDSSGDLSGSVNPDASGSGSNTGTGSNAGSSGELETLGIPVADKKATDGTQSTETTTRPAAVEVAPDNPPVARNDFLTISEADEVEISALLLSNDTDGDPGQSPRLVQVTSDGAQGGQLKFDGSAVRYVPNASTLNNLRGNETATETFTYRVRSGELTDTATLTVRLVGTNKPPVAADDQGEATEDSPLVLDVLANDTDPDGDALRIINVDNAGAQGSVAIAPDGRGLVYNPPDSLPAGAVAQDVFRYQVSDGQFTATATVTITVTGRNDPPVINTTGTPFAVSAGSGPTVIPLNVIFADSDLGAQLEVVSIDTNGTTGTVTIGSIIYDDNGRFRFLGEGQKGSDSFGVTVVDENGATGSGRYTLEIVGVNDAPEAFGDAYSVLPDQPFNVPATFGLLSNDTDIDGDVLQVNVTPVTGPSNGSLILGASGAFSYTPNTGFAGVDSFVYEVVDPFGAVSSATVVLTVTDAVSAPVAVPDAFTVSVNGSVNGNVLNNDFDPDNEPLFVTLANGTQNGSINLSPAGLFEYTPNTDFEGADSFTYLLTDASGQTSTTTVSLTVAGVNLAPEVVTINVQEVPAGQVSSVNLNNFFSDPEGGNLFFDFNSNAPFLTLNGSVLSVMPPAAALGLSFSVEVGASDGENITTTVFTIEVVDPNLAPDLVFPLNDQTILVGGSVNADVSTRFNDPDGDPLSFTLTTDAPFLTLAGSNLQGFTNAADAGTYTVTIGASDGKATTTSTFTLTVNSPPPNAPTVIVSGNNSTVTNTSTISMVTDSLSVTDADGLASNPFTVTAQGDNGVATIDGRFGGWTYVPNSTSFIGTDTFVVTVVDALGASTQIPINLIIRPLDTPTMFDSGLTGTGTEDMTITRTLFVNDPDPTIANPFGIASQPDNGSAVINTATGQWLYTPNAEFAGTDTFFVSYTDGYNYTQTQSVFVSVSPVNDQTPVADDESFTVVEGGTATEANLDAGVSLLDGDIDADLPGDTLQAFVLSGPSHDGGSLLVNTDGTFTYTHDGSENFTDSFTYHAYDGANTDTGTVTITITPVNDNAPVPDNESFTVVQGGTATASNLDVGATLLEGDTDADLPGDTLTVIAGSDSTSYGTVSVAADGTFSYTHDGSANFTDSFTYQVTDGVFTSTGTVNITISVAPNNPPTGAPVITGVSQVDQIVSADTASIADADGLGVFSYEWFADGVSVFGPTSTASYTVPATVVNKALAVKVTYTDGASFVETIASNSVSVGSQSPQIIGTQSYTLIPSVDDLLFGTNGVENLTLIGNAEAGDFVDLGDGVDTLILSGSNNVIGVESVEIITGSGGADTITIEGELDTLNGILLNRDAADLVIVDGDVLLFDEFIPSTAGDFQVASNGFLELGGSSGSILTLDDFSANDGHVILDSTNTSRITVAIGGSLINNSQFESRGPAGLAHEFDGTFINSAGGHLDIRKDLTFINGGTLDVRANTNSVFVELGQTLKIDNSSTLFVGPNTNVNGQGSILISNGSILLVDSSFVYDPGSPQLEFDGTSFINGGSFTIGAGANLTLMGDTVNPANVNIFGSLTIDGGGVTPFAGSVINNATAEFTLDSSIASGAAQITIGGLFTNSGLLALDNSDASAAITSSFTVSGGSFTNQANGVIQSIDDDLSLGANRHRIDATINNAGRIEVDANLLLNRSSATHVNNGQIELIAGGELHIENATSFTNLSGGRIFGDGSVVTDTPLIQQGILEPVGIGPVGTTINIVGDLDLEPSSTVDLDVFNAVGNHDVVNVSGQVDVEGSLKLNFVTIAGLEAGGTIENVLQFGSLGSNTDFIPMNVQHNLGTAYSVSVVSDGTAFDLVVVPSFADEFDDGAGGNSDWDDALNWLSDTVPTASDDVLVNGFFVDHPMTSGSNAVKSLTLLSTATLDIDNSQFEILESSRVDASSSLFVQNNATLKIAKPLVIEGTLHLGGADITTTTTTSFIHTLGASAVFDITTNATLGVDVRNDGGTINVLGSGTLIAPTNKIENNGTLNIDASPIIDTAIENRGQLFVGSAAGIASVSFRQFSQNLQNGTFNIDTPGSFNTNVILDNTFFRNFGTINFLDSGAAGGIRKWDLGGNGNFLENQGTINVFADSIIDIENATLVSDQGGFILAPGVNLDIDGGASGSSFQIGASTFFAGSGNLNFINEVEIDLIDDFFLNSTGVFFDTTGGNVTINNNKLNIGNASSLGLNAGDRVNSALSNFGTLTLTTDASLVNVHIAGQFQNFGTLQIDSSSGGGRKLFDQGFVNDGNLIMSITSLDSNILEIGDAGSATLVNNNFFQSDQFGGATFANTFRGTLVNNGSLQVDWDLELAEIALPVVHDNFGMIFINVGRTLTVAANNDLINHPGGVIVANGFLDVSGSNVDFVNEGLILPGGQSTTDVMNIVANANTVFDPDSEVEIDLNGTVAGSGYDQIAFSGAAAPQLGGRLNINLVSGFTPVNLDMFMVLTSVAALSTSFTQIEGTDLLATEGVVFVVDQTANDITLTARTPTILGTSGDDVLNGTAGADVIHGDDGNDQILGLSSGDTAFGGDGNDLFVADTGINRIVGGDGIDSVRITDAVQDLTSIAGAGYVFEEIEILDYEDAAMQTLTLDDASILVMVDGPNALLGLENAIAFFGDSNDLVLLNGDFVRVGDVALDIRTPGIFESFTILQNSGSNTHFAFGEEARVEVTESSGAKLIFGSSGADTITGGATPDQLYGRDGNDILDGGGNTDLIGGGAGNDVIHYDINDLVEAGFGLDTLIDDTPGATIDFTGLTNFTGFEAFDMRDADGNDSLTIGVADVLNFASGDNGLDAILPDGQIKFVIEGDIGDALNLDGNAIHTALSTGSLVGGWTAPNGAAESDYLSNGTNYLKLTNGSVDLYVHEDVSNVV